MISSKRLWAVAWKETIQVRRDFRSLVLALGMPLLLLFLFGYALSLDVERVPTRFVDWDHTEESRLFKDKFKATRYFEVQDDASDVKSLETDILRGDVLVGIVIPEGFMADMRREPLPPVQVLLDASDSLTSNIALGYVNAVATLYGLEITKIRTNRMGLKDLRVPAELRARVWYNPDLESRNFIIPGLIAVISMIIAAQLTALTVAREWETGTMEWLIATPIRPLELVLGKLIPYIAIGFLNVAVLVAVGTWVFQVPLRGSAPLLFAYSFVFLVGALSMGLLISIRAKTQILASQVAILTSFLPSFLLSGFVYPIDNMPQVLQYITYLIPTRYLIVVLKGLFLKGVGVSILWGQAVLLGLFAVLMLVLCARQFHKRLTV